MKTTELNNLGHILISAGSAIYKDDYICKNCMVRLHIRDRENSPNVIENYVNDDNPGNIFDDVKYNLTCAEQLIKNLLE